MNSSFPLFGQREKPILVAMAILILLLVAYFSFGRALHAHYLEYQREIPAQRDLLGWMEKSAQIIKASQANRPRPAAGDSPSAAVTAVAKELQVEKFLKRVEPAAEKGVRVTFEEVGFDTLLALLVRLQEREALVATEVAVERGKEPGAVNALLTLSGGRS